MSKHAEQINCYGSYRNKTGSEKVLLTDKSIFHEN